MKKAVRLGGFCTEGQDDRKPTVKIGILAFCLKAEQKVGADSLGSYKQNKLLKREIKGKIALQAEPLYFNSKLIIEWPDG